MYQKGKISIIQKLNLTGGYENRCTYIMNSPKYKFKDHLKLKGNGPIIPHIIAFVPGANQLRSIWGVCKFIVMGSRRP